MGGTKPKNLESGEFPFLFLVFLLPFNPTFPKCVKTVSKRFQSVHYLIIQRLFSKPTTALNALLQKKTPSLSRGMYILMGEVNVHQRIKQVRADW